MAPRPCIMFLVATAARGAATGAPVCADPAGVCPEQQPTTAGQLAGDHLLLQFNTKFAGSKRVGKDEKVVGPCSELRDVEEHCETTPTSCKVRADKMTGRTCAEYCGQHNFACTGAWEEVDETCQALATLTCHQTYPGTSDLLCQCDPTRPPIPTPRTLVWADEFDSDSVDRSKWAFQTGGGGFGNDELQHYTDRTDNARVERGSLKVVAKCESFAREHFTSAKLMSVAEWGPGHRVEVRAKVPTNRGAWPAIWMLPRTSSYGDWPKSGEIDIMESVGCNPGKIYGTIHTQAYNHVIHTEKQSSMTTDAGEWKVYAIDWQDGRIEWYLDGVKFHTFAPDGRESAKWPFDQQFYLILNVAVGGSWGGWCLDNNWPSCSSGDQFGKDQVMEVDYARVYKLGESDPAAHASAAGAGESGYAGAWHSEDPPIVHGGFESERHDQ